MFIIQISSYNKHDKKIPAIKHPPQTVAQIVLLHFNQYKAMLKPLVMPAWTERQEVSGYHLNNNEIKS